MKRAMVPFLLLLPFCPSILAQVSVQESSLYGITDTGEFITIDRDTGAGTLLWDLPPQYFGVDSLVYSSGYFYASYGAFAGGGKIVQFTLQPGSDIDLSQTLIGSGPSIAFSIEDMAVGPNRKIYVAYNDTTPSAPSPANKIGIFNISPAGCSIAFVAAPSDPAFYDLDAISFDRFGNLWIANLQSPARWGQMLIPSGQVLNAVNIGWKLVGLTAKGRASGQAFYAVTQFTDFGPSFLKTIDHLGVVVDIGPIGFSAVNGLALVSQRRILESP